MGGNLDNIEDFVSLSQYRSISVSKWTENLGIGFENENEKTKTDIGKKPWISVSVLVFLNIFLNNKFQNFFKILKIFISIFQRIFLIEWRMEKKFSIPQMEKWDDTPPENWFL